MNEPSSYNHLSQKLTFSAKVTARLIRHVQQAIGSLGDLWRTPFTSIMTVLVLGISLTLPATLHLFVKNAKTITEQWDTASEISLFLKLSVTEKSAKNLIHRIELYPEVSKVTYISAQQALIEFKIDNSKLELNKKSLYSFIRSQLQ
mgnify:CR=1 FL=1